MSYQREPEAKDGRKADCPGAHPSRWIPEILIDGAAQSEGDDKQRPDSAAKLLCATVVGAAMQPDAEKKRRPIDQGTCEFNDRGRCAQSQVVRVPRGECGQHERVQREGQAEAPRSEVLGVRRVPVMGCSGGPG